MNNELMKTQSDGDETSTSDRTRRGVVVDEAHLHEDEKQKLESRRAYNRQCAAKARKRSKELVAHLQTQVEELTKDKAELKRENDVMRAQLELLENQNKALMMNQLVQQQGINSGMNNGLNNGLNNNGYGANPNFLGNTFLNSASGSSMNHSSTTTTSSTSNGHLGNNHSNMMQQMSTLNPQHQQQQNISSDDLTTLLTRLASGQLQPFGQHQQHMASMGGSDNGQLAALLGLSSLLQAQNDPNKNLSKH